MVNRIILVVVVILANVYAEDILSAIEYERQQPRYLEFRDEDGVTHVINIQAKPSQNVSSLNIRNRYLLYTRKNRENEQYLIWNDAVSIKRSHFNPKLITVVVSHGWHCSPYNSLNPDVKNAFLNKTNVNVIILDWKSIADLDYASAVAAVPKVGQALGYFLGFLNNATGAPLSRMHLVGHSLGAHVVANAGRTLGGSVARITGLDPAGPLWYMNQNHLKSTDAIYVETIHTNALALGIMSHCGHVDIFPNGGQIQPGCNDMSCNHARSWRYFAATVTYNHLIGHRCDNVSQMINDTCRGPELHMGNDELSKKGSGIYRLKTKEDYPY